jgi:hypothetical protein
MVGPGTFSVKVVTPNGTTNTEVLTVAAQSTNAPTLVSAPNPQTATTNTTVTLYGTNLQGATGVQFYNSANTLVATIGQMTVSSDSSNLTFTLGGSFLGMVGPGTFSVKVVTPNGTTNTEVLTVAAQSTNAPTVSQMNPTASVAPGTTINVAGTSYDNTTYVSIDNGAWTLTPSVYAMGTTLSFVLPSNIGAGSHTVQIGNKGSAYSAVTAGTITVAVASTPVLNAPTTSSAAPSQGTANTSVTTLQQEIASLTAQLQSLEAQLAAAGGSTATWCHTFNGNLSIGMSGSDVTALQTALQKDGESTTVNGTFDDQTAAAVTTFQQKYQSAILAPYGLSNGTGYAGKGTRAELNSLFGCTAQ